MKRLALALIVAALPFTATAQILDEVVEVESASETNLEKAQSRQEAQQALWSFLQESRVPGADTARIRADLSETDRAILDDPDLLQERKRARQVGVHKELSLMVNLQQESQSQRLQRRLGDTAVAPDGDTVWTTSVQSEGATALRIRFESFDLPDGAALFLYNESGQAHGPYTARGPNDKGAFWSHTVFGDQAWIQLHYFGDDLATFAGIQFEIAAVSHIGEGFALPAMTQNNKADCSYTEDCVLNVNCYTAQSLNTARKAVARVIYDSDGTTYVCSGGLLNDSNSAHRKPWFLTANHCISTADEADSVEAFFQYQSSCGSCSASYSESILGADLRAHGPHSTGDFALLELSDLPSSWGLLGWTTANQRSSVGTTLNILSHPQGAPQSFSQQQVVDPSGYSNLAAMYSTVTLGTIEGGSSGAPVFLSGGQVVGLHSGANKTSSSAIDRCDSNTFDSRSGNFAYFWKSVRPYLSSPSGTYKMHVSAVSAGTKKIFFNLYFGKAKVTVVDELGNGVPGVTVTGTFSNGLSGSSSGVTDEDGEATILSGQASLSKPNFTFCVTNLTHDYFNTYDSASNSVTCASR